MEIRYSEALKNLGTLNLKNTNKAGENLYENEKWLSDNAADGEIDGVEFLNFAKHLDGDGNGVITEEEVNNWQKSNVDAGNEAHKDFSFDMIAELFSKAINKAEESNIADCAEIMNFESVIDTNNFFANKENQIVANYYAQQGINLDNYEENGKNLVDFDGDGVNDANVVYKKDENGLVTGAQYYSTEDDTALFSAKFQLNNDNLSGITIDNGTDGKDDYMAVYQNNKIIAEQEMQYSVNSDTTKSIFHNSEGQVTSYAILKNTFGKNGNPVGNETVTQYDNNGALINATITKAVLDENGNPTNQSESLTYNSQGNFASRTLSTISLDENNNPTITQIAYADIDSNDRVIGKITSNLNQNLETVSIKQETVYFEDTNAKDGNINYTRQGGVGDCWLLATLNGVKDYEPQVIDNMFKYTENGSVVHLAVGDYEVSDAELAERKQTTQYNYTDDDIIRIEIAMEKALNDYKNGEIEFNLPENTAGAEYIKYKHNDEKQKADKMLIEGGYSEQAYYFLTGKLPESVHEPENIEGNADTKEYIANMKDSINNKEKFGVVILDVGSSAHACTITEISDDYVEYRDPQEESGVKRISMNDFLQKNNRIALYKVG